jgi:hypothetical protein
VIPSFGKTDAVQVCPDRAVREVKLLADLSDSFTLTATGQPSRTYTSITQARQDGNDARAWGGMHYPSTVVISDAEGEAIANS